MGNMECAHLKIMLFCTSLTSSPDLTLNYQPLPIEIQVDKPI